MRPTWIFHSPVVKRARRRLVAQVFNLLFRRLPVGSVFVRSRRSAGWKPAMQSCGGGRSPRYKNGWERCRPKPGRRTPPPLAEEQNGTRRRLGACPGPAPGALSDLRSVSPYRMNVNTPIKPSQMPRQRSAASPPVRWPFPLDGLPDGTGGSAVFPTLSPLPPRA